MTNLPNLTFYETIKIGFAGICNCEGAAEAISDCLGIPCLAMRFN